MHEANRGPFKGTIFRNWEIIQSMISTYTSWSQSSILVDIGRVDNFSETAIEGGTVFAVDDCWVDVPLIEFSW